MVIDAGASRTFSVQGWPGPSLGSGFTEALAGEIDAAATIDRDRRINVVEDVGHSGSAKAAKRKPKKHQQAEKRKVRGTKKRMRDRKKPRLLPGSACFGSRLL